MFTIHDTLLSGQCQTARIIKWSVDGKCPEPLTVEHSR
ncbi:Uncharacterized protein dnm_059460 [Desulfonema magnum]|uniref:Uncharacterized protein n=1 Tax=Desulfonema magnum TaxID=45655 RepID=A0A975BRT4_9BACT|nr:Uncharacterized protein dnm_059460 [Desulfonema magnum]